MGGPGGEGGGIDDGARCLRASSVARQGSVLGADSPLIAWRRQKTSVSPNFFSLERPLCVLHTAALVLGGDPPPDRLAQAKQARLA